MDKMRVLPPSWNTEEMDHYKSMYEFLRQINYNDDEANIIAYRSADLLRYKREFNN